MTKNTNTPKKKRTFIFLNANAIGYNQDIITTCLPNNVAVEILRTTYFAISLKNKIGKYLCSQNVGA